MTTLLSLGGVTLPTSYASTPTGMRSGRWSVTVVPTSASGAFPLVATCVIDFSIRTARAALIFDGSGGIVRFMYQNVSRVARGSLVFSAGQPITITVDSTAGTLTIQGCTSGDGTSTGTAWPSIGDGIMHVGAYGVDSIVTPSYFQPFPGAISSVTDDAATAVTDPNILFSPYNWGSDGAGAIQANHVRASSTKAWTTHSGAGIRLALTSELASAPVVLNLTPSRLAGGESVVVYYALDTAQGSATITNASATTLTIATTLTAGAHTLEIWTDAVTATDRWTTPSAAIEVTGVKLPPGVSLTAPVQRGKLMLAFGDSVTDAGISSFAQHAGKALDCEVGVVGFSGQGWNVDVPTRNVPAFSDSWDKYAAGASRLDGGLLSPAPDYVLINHGQNDTDNAALATTVASTLAAIAVAAPRARIILNVPFSGQGRTNITAAARPGGCVLTDTRVREWTSQRQWYCPDGIHPNNAGAGLVAAALVVKIRDAWPAFASGRRTRR